MYIADAETD